MASSNFAVACLLGALAAGVVGALIALSVRRLGTLELALATFGLAWVAYFLLFENSGISNSSSGYTIPAPSLNLFGIHTFQFSSSGQLVGLLLLLFGLITVLIHNLQSRAQVERCMQ